MTDKTEPSKAQSNVPAQNVKTETEVRVSPHGFGPYPKVPEDYPSTPEWERRPDNPRKTFELMSRVFVKLWTEGEKNFYGGSTLNGRIYPHYYDTVYLKRIPILDRDGNVRGYSTSKRSGRFVNYKGDTSIETLLDPPPGLRVLDLDSSGIDPYQYLDLPYKKNNKKETN